MLTLTQAQFQRMPPFQNGLGIQAAAASRGRNEAMTDRELQASQRQRLVRTLIIELLTKAVEGTLLGAAVSCWRASSLSL